MTLNANSYVLRNGAGKYAQAANTIRQGANRFKTMAHQMQQGSQGWQGEAAQAFLAKCDLLHGDYLKTGDALDRISGAMNTLAAKIDHINELRNQAKFMTDRMYVMVVKTDDDKRTMEDMRRQASSISYSAEMEARAADEVAASVFREIATVERSLQSLSHPSTGRGGQSSGGGIDDLPEPYRSYYKRHPELYQDPDQTLPAHIDRDMFFLRLNGMSRDELIRILKDQLRTTEVPGYITNKKEADEIVDSAFEHLYGDLKDHKDYLITAIKTNVLTAENNEEIAKKIQAAEDVDVTSASGFDFVMSQGWEPTGVSGDGLISMSTSGLFQKYAPKDSKADKIEGKPYDYFDTTVKHEEEDDGALNTAKRNQYMEEDADEDLNKIEDAQSIANNLNKSEELHGGDSSKISYKKISEAPAEDVNKWWKDEMGYTEPPYMPGTFAQVIELTEKSTFVRVYDGENSGMYGGWFMKAEDIKGLTPSQIQNKFALPTTPKFIADVELDTGTKIRTGIVNPLFGFEGGGQQFDLMGQFVGNFVNPRPLP